jgi:Bacterial Ig domain
MRLFIVLALLAAALPGAARAADTSGYGWSAGPGGGDNTYDGYIDMPTDGASVAIDSPLRVGGWVVDKTAQGWAGIDQIQVFRGTMDGGGAVLATADVAQARPDVGAALGNDYYAASGFSAVIPPGALPAGPATLTVYAHAPGKGWWYKQVTVDVHGRSPASRVGLVATVTQPSAGAPIASTRTYTLRGSAYDTGAAGGSGVDRVEVYLDGPRGGAAAHLLGDAGLSGTDWALDFSPQQWATSAVEHRRLFVYARSAATGSERLVTSDFYIDPYLTR